MSDERVVREAQFNPQVRMYWLLNVTLLLSVTVVGIPLLLIWIPVGLAVTSLYLKNLSCVLTNRALKVKSGIIFRQERTIPLEKITDLAMVQGPVMRMMNIEALGVETAGQSSPTGSALVRLVGIVDARAFRDEVFRQKDRVIDRDDSLASGSPPAALGSAEELAVLREIRDSLARIESRLGSASAQQP